MEQVLLVEMAARVQPQVLLVLQLLILVVVEAVLI
jgi:hypothetical protein